MRRPKLRGHGLRPAQSYSPQEIAKGTGFAETTVQRWIREGELAAMTGGNPHLVLGSDAIAYFQSMVTPPEPLQKDEFRCMHCKAARKPWGGIVDYIQKPGAKTGRLEALCDGCQNKMSRGISPRDLPHLMKVFEICEPGAARN